ncbi:TPA: sugar transferase [Streptococcus suis]|nr:sugar transferase [Streptococcus suis]
MNYTIEKRCLDVLLALILIIPSLVLVIIFAFLIYFTDFHNPFFVQKRLGYKGKEFNLIKLRSMRIDAEKSGAQWATKNDSRVTWIGNFIRKTRIDELPQLINILKGDMSFVGPRPERKELADQFVETIPTFNERLEAIPGLTGLAQLSGGYDLSPSEKLVYDLEYIEKANVMLDLKLIIKTVKVVFTGEGAR